MGVLKITEANFDREVVFADKPVLVEFWATWASPCKKLSPIINEIAEELGDQITVARVNVDEEMDIAAQFHAFRLPMLAVVKNGEITNSTFGIKSKETIIGLLDL